MYFLPEFKEALDITYVVVFSQVMGSINVLNIVGKNYQYLLIIFISLIINILLSIILVIKFDLIGVAYATFISFLLFNILTNYFNLKYFNKNTVESFKVIIRIAIVPVYCFLIADNGRVCNFQSLFKCNIRKYNMDVYYRNWIYDFNFTTPAIIKEQSKHT